MKKPEPAAPFQWKGSEELHGTTDWDPAISRPVRASSTAGASAAPRVAHSSGAGAAMALDPAEHGDQPTEPGHVHWGDSEFESIRTNLMARWNPADDLQRNLVDTMAREQSRLEQVRIAEIAFFEQLVAEVQTQGPGIGSEEALGRVFASRAQHGRLRLFLAHKASVERAYLRALDDLRIGFGVSKKEAERRAQMEALIDRSLNNPTQEHGAA